MPVTGYQARGLNRARAIRGAMSKSVLMKSILGPVEYARQRASKVRDRHLQRKFGISLLDYNILLKSQNGNCAICHKPQEVGDKSLAVDHCHKTGKVRGILCRRCNSILGYAGDSVEVLRAAVDYLS